MEECLLFLGIPVRRMFMMPYSPFNMDNHVVVEFFSSELEKWIMIDPTTDCYLIDETFTPLSLVEMRSIFANNGKIVPIFSRTTVINRKDLFDIEFERNISLIKYYSKNSFYFMCDMFSTFGNNDKTILTFIPINFDLKSWKIDNCRFRFKYLTENKEKINIDESVIVHCKKYLKQLQCDSNADIICDINLLTQKPNL